MFLIRFPMRTKDPRRYGTLREQAARVYLSSYHSRRNNWTKISWFLETNEHRALLPLLDEVSKPEKEMYHRILTKVIACSQQIHDTKLPETYLNIFQTMMRNLLLCKGPFGEREEDDTMMLVEEVVRYTPKTEKGTKTFIKTLVAVLRKFL
jgi:hypothetical protein